ncbi:MAG: hypothetical protein EPO22_13870, partial [Dehalococcoidia bacterium]
MQTHTFRSRRPPGSLRSEPLRLCPIDPIALVAASVQSIGWIPLEIQGRQSNRRRAPLVVHPMSSRAGTPSRGWATIASVRGARPAATAPEAMLMPLSSARNKDKRQLMVISHTHWDREWYLPYQSFRVRLVGLFDMLLDIFDSDPGYKHFMLDGHTIPLEDYLEVRPDRFDDLERVVQQGKLLVGPWYIIPDEALPGGEALVRNILRGHRVAKAFGPVMKVGYIPDPFGQIAHMPAIFRGFGIEYATMWRGADDSLKTSEFFWRSPDGSEVLTIHKPKGYGSAASLPQQPKQLLARIQAIRDELEPLATTPYVLVMNGSDHLPPQPELSSMIRAANMEIEGAVLEHSSLPEVFDNVRRYIGDRAHDWPVHMGEFRSGQRAHLLPGVLSARMWIKQQNQECEDLLAHWAEPFSTWADILKKQVG